jgi:hypothetical protein
MPKRDKKKDKKKKKKLTDKEILKLLKALKPKTQQIVRVNVGDREKKKKESANLNPPFIFPSQGFPSIVNLGQAPPPQAPAPTIQAPVPQPPVPRIQAPPPPTIREAPLLLTDIDTEAENIVIKRKTKKRDEEQRLGYTVSEPRFRKPKQANPSQLAAESAIPTKITELPSTNDKFISFDIQTNQDSDQMGNIAQPFTSEEWSLSPDGNVLSVEEMQEQNITKPPAPPVEETVEETFNVEETFSPPPPPVDILPTKEEIAKGKEIKSKFLKPKKSQIISDLNIAISKGEIDVNDLPPEFFNKKGGAVGKLKETITLSALQPYWEELYVKKSGFGMGS